MIDIGDIMVLDNKLTPEIYIYSNYPSLCFWYKTLKYHCEYSYQSYFFVSAFSLDFIVTDYPIQPEHSLVTNLSSKLVLLKQIC